MPRKLVEWLLERISSDRDGGDHGVPAKKADRGYQRVPSHGTISASTTSTSLVTDFDPHHFKQANFLHEPPLAEIESESSAEEEEDFERARLHFQQNKQISVGSTKIKMEMDVRGGNKSDNLRNVVPFVKQLSTDSVKIKDDYSLNGDPSPYKPTTHKINYMAQLLAAIAVSLGNMVIGFTSGYSSPAVVSMYNDTSIEVTEDQGTWVGGIMPLTALVGGLLGGLMIVRLGRRNTIMALAIPFVISWLIIASATNVYIIYLGRAIGGVLVGIGSLVIPVYLGEVLQPEVRGQLGLMPTALGNIGVLISYSAGMYLDWSMLAYLGAILPLGFLVMTALVPETPRWYVSKGNHKAARASLEWLRGKDADVDAELKDIIKSQEEAERETSSIFDLLKRGNRLIVTMLLILMFCQQFSGINAVMFYTVEIFKSAGSNIHENIATIIIGIVNFISTFVATFLIDRLGRKILLYISSIAMILTLAPLGGYFYMRSTSVNVEAYGSLPLICLVIYVIGFSIGFGPIPWLMLGEVLPSKVKGSAASVVTAFNWFCAFIITKTFKLVINIIGQHGIFWFYGGICIFALFFTIFWVPETKGKSLEDIERKMNGNKK